VIEHVVDQLEGGTDVPAVGGGGFFLLGCGAANDGADLGGGLEQLGRFVAHDLQIAVHGHIGIMHVQQLQDLAFGNDGGGGRQNGHGGHGVVLDHHFE